MSRVVSGRNNPSALLAHKITNTLTEDVEDIFYIKRGGAVA